jgi:glucose/arabinose dehydrogenase
MSGGMRARIRIALLAGCLLGLLLGSPRADALSLQPVGSFDSPVFVTSPPGDPRLFVVERAGTIQVVHDGAISQFLDIHTMVNTDGERGMLSMAFDPNYAANGLFYVFFNDSGTAGAPLGDIHVDEFRVSANQNVADAGSRRPILTVNRATSASNHNGGQLQFGKDGFLYVSVGDAANSANAQNPGNLNGKILRVDPHGGGGPQVWSLGLRNPFRFSFDHLTGDMLIGDVGSSGTNVAEEINLAPLATGLGGGANYGWPICEGFSGSCPGATRPVFAYPHTDPGGDAAFGCAIIGGYVYRGSQAPEVAGRYLYADNCTGQLRSIQLGLPLASGDRSESTEGELGNPQSFGEDASCNLYVANTSTVFRIVGSGGAAGSVCASAPAKKCQCAKKKRPKKCKKRKHKKKRVAESKKKHKKKCKKKRKKKK